MIGRKFKFSQWSGVYCVIALFMSMAFCFIYGVRILNPVYTDWLMRGGDTVIHYMGWKAYRAGDWMFPIGCTDVLSYPDKISVIFTDSIPCFAVIFKLLSPILPKEFQYFGLWGIMCFVLQGILSARIIKYYCKNKIFVAAAGIIFGFVPVMIWRMYAHTALAGQWILLLALEPVFAYKKYANDKKIFILWTVTGLLASSIHIYFVAMCGMILVGYCIADMTAFKRVKRSAEALCVYLGSCMAAIGILGGFSSGVSAQDGGLGIHSMNLNALFNPQGWSLLIKDLPLYGGGQYEGFAYLGAGVLLALIITAVKLLTTSAVRSELTAYKSEITAFAIIFLLSFIIALSPVITLGDKVLFQYSLPELIISCWSVFRASGRMIWVGIYVIMLITVLLLYRSINNKKLAVLIMTVCTIVQIYDIHIVLTGKKESFTQEYIYEYESELADQDFWNQLGAVSDIRHVYFSKTVKANLYTFADWAFHHNKTLNRFYFARQAGAKTIDKNMEAALQKADDDSIFIFSENDSIVTEKYDFNYYAAEGFIIGYAGKLDFAEALPKMKKKFLLEFSDNLYLQNGQDDENGVRSVFSGGLSYGPYWEVPADRYEITINGNNLDKAEFVIYSQRGTAYHNFTIESQTSERSVLSIALEEDIEDLEIVVRNNSENIIQLYSIEMQ